MTGLQPDGLSHSEIRGSRVICTYPRLVAAYHVLHRLREPRHPPYALNYFPYLLRNWLLASCAADIYFQLYFLLSYYCICLCQYVKDLLPLRDCGE